MTYLNNLYQVYENNKDKVGVKVEGCRCLLPRYHGFQNAHIDVVLDINGNFLRAMVVPKEDKSTVIPGTEKSFSRTGNDAPHGIFDTLEFIAGDFFKWFDVSQIEDDKQKQEKYIKKVNKYNIAYKKQLEDFCNFAKNDKLNAVNIYLSKNQLVGDLVGANIFKTENERIIYSVADENYPIYKLSVSKPTASLVRFSVEVEGDPKTKLYADAEIIELWEKFIDQKDSDKELCYILGKELKRMDTHPKFIRNAGDKTKLISSNDNENFTFRGRFSTSEEAFSVSTEASEKIHSALKWLIDRQGYKRDGQCFVCYGTKTTNIPNLLDEIAFENDDDLNSENTMTAYSTAVKNAFYGYRMSAEKQKINVIGFDNATAGRLAVVINREFLDDDYYDLLEKWYGSLCYEKSYFVNKQFAKKLTIQTPTPNQILFACYGERINGKENVKLRHGEITRILNCILNGSVLPKDIMQKSFNRLCNKLAFEKELTWLDTVRTFLAMYKNTSKEEVKMALDENKCTRSYLYGRLLAVAEVAEREAIKGEEKAEERQTNATRYFNQFAIRPFRTYTTIRMNLNPYLCKLKSKRKYYDKMINDIKQKFNNDDYSSNKSLDGEFLLGYEHQIKYIYTKKEKNEEIIED